MGIVLYEIHQNGLFTFKKSAILDLYGASQESIDTIVEILL